MEWEVKSLGEVCEIELGKTPLRANPYFWDKDKKTNNVWLSIADLPIGNKVYVGDSKEYISNEAVSFMRYVKKGTLMVSFKLTLGRLAFAKKNLFTNEAIASLDIFDEKSLDKDFLYYFLLNFNWDAAAKGDHKVKGKTLNKEKLKKINISYPNSLKEQKRIVEILDETFEKLEKVKENTQKKLENAKEIFESTLNDIFENPKEDWEEKTLENLGKITSSKRIYKSDYTKSGIPFYRTKEIKELSNKKNISIELFISNEKFKEISQKFGTPKEGDILITAIGTIGEIYVIENEEKFYFKDGNVLWIKDFYSINSNFLRYNLISFIKMIKKLSHGAAYNALPIEKLKKHLIRFPNSLEQQQQIVEKLDELQEKTKQLEIIYQKQLDNIEELKKSILQKAFKGELR